MTRPSTRDLTQEASRPEQWLLLALVLGALLLGSLDALLWRPGFSAYDEESQLDLLQAWREGQGLFWRLGYGCLHRAAAAGLMAVLGPSEAWARLPSQLALPAELALLYLWLKPRLGGHAALWACLADLVCGATFARSRSMLSFSLLPAVFLAHAVALDRLKRPWHHALFAASALLWLLDYEGWALGLAWLLPAWALRHGRGEGRIPRWAGLGLGLAAGGTLVASLSLDLAGHWSTRMAASTSPLNPWWSVVSGNVAGLLGGGPRLPFSAADGQPWPSPWIWPLVALGAGTAWRRFPGAWGLLAAGSLPLLLNSTSAEPHRLSLALLALAAAAGAGAARVAGAVPWGRAALAALLAAGLLSETLAWSRVDPLKLSLAYGRSRDLKAAARWLRNNSPPGGWRMLDGLGPYQDGSFRLLLAGMKVETRGAVPVALVHGDYAPALLGLKGTVVPVGDAQALPLMLYLPGPAEAARLKAIRDEVTPFREASRRSWPDQVRQGALKRLREPGVRDPWVRTIYWELWMQANLLLNSADADAFRRAQGEALVSGWIFDAGASALQQALPEQARLLRQRAEAADPRRKDLSPRHQRF